MPASRRMKRLRHNRDVRRIPLLTLLMASCSVALTYAFISPTFRSSQHSIIRQSRQLHHSSSSLSRSVSILFMAPKRTEPADEEADWKALLAAFKMYKAAYGDLKVPSRFIVPGMPPWPENAWGMKLGQRVAQIRSTGKFVQNNEERRKILDDMGFLWRLRATERGADVSFDQIYSALETYKQETGKTTVPSTFVVPDCDPWPESTRGLPLGKKVAAIRSKSFLKNNPDAKRKLDELGFPLSGKVAANDQRFQKVYDALVTYKKLNGDLLVPQPFVVPEQSDDWPESTWGLRLGARVNAIRSQGTFVNTNPDRRKQLDEIGFVWSPPPSLGGRKRGRRTKEQMEAQRAAEDAAISKQIGEEMSSTSAMEDLFGPSFAIDQTTFGTGSKIGEDSSPPSWSVDGTGELGAAQAAKEAAKQPQDEYQEPVNLNDTLETAKNNAIAAGVIVVDDDGIVRKGKQQKNIPWFNDDFGQDFVFEDVVEALTVYKSMYGDFSGLVENDEFVVPAGSEGDSLFPNDDEDEAFDVDASSRAAAAIASYEREGKRQESEDLIAAEIERLQQETESATMATETDVAVQTKISDVSWPEHLAGMGLGNIVRRIRDGSLEVKHLPERKAQLDAIDFDWGDPKYFIDIPFEKAMCSMYAYYLVRGDMFVYEDFVMPDEEPWPRALAGYELGKAVRRIRELQNSFEAYHTEKVALLRAIDFLWFPSVALPLDPNEPEMSAEMVIVSALGHPDYAKMIDIPMGLPDKIIADGPFFETDDPKLWWRKWHNWDYVKDYWYNEGRRDNAFVLRENGYPTLAAEHEAKYGPGMFQQIEELMSELREGVEGKSKEEKDAYIEKLNYFREEMAGCEDIPWFKQETLLEELDTALLALMTDGKLENVTEETLEQLEAMEQEQAEYDALSEEEVEIDTADYAAAVDTIDDYEEGNEDDEDDNDDEDYDDEDFDDDDDDDFDIIDELGLDDDDNDEDLEDDGEILAESTEDDLIELEEDDAFA